SQDPLHDERDRVVQRPGTEACQRKRSLSERRVSLQGAVRRGRSRRKAMDEVSTWLEPSHEPVGAPLRGTPAHLNPAIASYTENRTDPRWWQRKTSSKLIARLLDALAAPRQVR